MGIENEIELLKLQVDELLKLLELTIEYSCPEIVQEELKGQAANIYMMYVNDYYGSVEWPDDYDSDWIEKLKLKVEKNSEGN